MLLRGLPELALEMAEGTLREQVHNLAARRGDPLDRRSPVHESQGFDLSGMAAGGGPGADFREGVLLPDGHAGGTDLDPVDFQFLQEQACDGQFLVRIERYAGGLFPVPEGRIQDFNHRFS